MQTKLVDLELQIHHETKMGLLVSADGNRNAAVWLPKSVVEVSPRRGSAICDVTLPEHLAFAKGLV